MNNELQSEYDKNWSVCILSSHLLHTNEISVGRFHYGTTGLIQIAVWGHPRPRLILSCCYQPPWCIYGWRTRQKAADSHWSDAFDSKMQLEAGHDFVGGYRKSRCCTFRCLNLRTHSNDYFVITQPWFLGLHDCTGSITMRCFSYHLFNICQ